MRKLTITKSLELIGPTEGALRYREINSSGVQIHRDDEGATIGDFYIRKAAIYAPPPKKIEITLEFEI